MTITFTKAKLAIAICVIAVLAPAVASATHVFNDVPDDKFYAAPVEWAADNGITTGKSPTQFAPDDDVTRGESVTFLKRYNDNVVEAAVADLEAADTAVAAAAVAAQTSADSNAANIAALPVGPAAATTGRLDSCNNDKTAPGEELADQFLACTTPLSFGVDGSHSVLLTAHIGWKTLVEPAEGECQLQRDGVAVENSTITMGELVDTTSSTLYNWASVTAMTDAVSGEAAYTLGCRERQGDIDWRDISLSAIVVAPLDPVVLTPLDVLSDKVE